MPISQYDQFFGGNAQKAYDALVKQYGEKKGKSIFYAKVNIAKRSKGNGKN